MVDLDDDDDDDDDDDLSVTSTINEEHDSEEEWLVEEVLVEVNLDDKVKYLVLWEGFDLQDATWEPKHHLQSGVLTSWEATKKEHGKPTAPGFRIQMWRDARLREIRRSFAKHHARNRKRARLGMKQHVRDYTLDDSIGDLDRFVDSSDGSGDKIAKCASDEPSRKPNSKTSTSELALQGIQHAPRNSEHKHVTTTQPVSDPGESRAKRLHPQYTASDTNIASRPVGQAESAGVQNGTREARATRLDDRLKQLRRKPNPLIKSKTRPNQAHLPVSSGNGGPEQACNVFAGGKERKQKTTLLDAALDPNKVLQMLNARRRRLIQKGNRDREGTRAPVFRPSLPDRAKFLAEPADVVSPIELSLATSPTEPDQMAITPKPDPDNSLRLGAAGAGLINAVRTYNSQATERRSSTEHAVSDRRNECAEKILTMKKRRVTFSLEVDVVPAAEECSDTEGELFVKSEAQDFSIAPARQERWVLPERPIVPEKRGSRQQAILKTFCITKGGLGTVAFKFPNISPEQKGTDWFQSFNAYDEIVLTHLCSATDLLLQVGPIGLQRSLAWSGPISTSGTDHPKAAELSRRLLQASLAATARLSKTHILLILPARSADWADLYKACEVIPRHGIALSYIVLQMDETVGAEAMANTYDISDVNHQGGSCELATRTFDLFFGLGHELLQRLGDTDVESLNVYLAFPPEASQEALLMHQWLHYSKPKCKVKSSLYPGQWASFIQSSSGHVVVHEDALSVIRLIPNFSDLLHSPNGKIDIWLYSPSARVKQNQLATNAAYSGFGLIRLSKILVSGTAMLATPSFFVAQPEQGYKFLKWFCKRLKNTEPDQSLIKLVVWPDIAEWLLKLSGERGRPRQSRRDSPGGEQNLSGVRESDQILLFKSYSLINELVVDMELTDEGPLVFAPDAIHGDDEQSLVNWFGHWSLNHVDKYRRMFVVGSSDQGSSRLSRYTEPVSFVPSTTDDPHKVENAEQTMQTDEDRRRLSKRRFLNNDSGLEIRKFLTEVERTYAGLQFCPLVLYRTPVAYWYPDMAFRFHDYKSEFASYAKWFSFFIEPFFVRFKNATAAKRHRSRRNTHLGLFYTVEGEWNEFSTGDSGAGSKKRRPWIAAYRPTEIHRSEWNAMEVFIWDPHVASHSDNKRLTEAELITAQRELVKYIRQTTQGSSDMLPLERVWLGGYESNWLNGFEEPLDAALDWIRNVSHNVKEWLPTSHTALLARGWRRLNLNAGRHPANTCHQPKEAAVCEGEEESKQRVTAAICHPPPGNGIIKTSRCTNLFLQTVSRHRGDKPVKYTFTPTLEWYGEQLAEGRGFHHIKVTTWESVFSYYGINES